jgi:hypothetical protein
MPSRAVLDAFGAAGEPEPLPGGTGRSWRIGALVLKPLDRAPAEIEWQADVLGSVREDGPGRWLDITAAGERLHAALAGVPRPGGIVAPGVEPWATGDRVAWGAERFEGLDDLLAALRPVTEPNTLIHGDLTGNVLFAEGLSPAIIDFTPYWHPRPFASAVVVADALVWEGAPPELGDAVDPQYLLRALIYRGVTSMVAGTEWRPTLELARRIAAGCA